MEASQRWGLAAVLTVAIGAIAFVTVQYDRFVGLAAIPLLGDLAIVFAKPLLAPRAAIIGGLTGIALSIGYMVYAAIRGDDIADPHAAIRSVQITLAVCGLVLLTGRAAAMRTRDLVDKPPAKKVDEPHKSTDAIKYP